MFNSWIILALFQKKTNNANQQDLLSCKLRQFYNKIKCHFNYYVSKMEQSAVHHTWLCCRYLLLILHKLQNVWYHNAVFCIIFFFIRLAVSWKTVAISSFLTENKPPIIRHENVSNFKFLQLEKQSKISCFNLQWHPIEACDSTFYNRGHFNGFIKNRQKTYIL